MDINIYDIIIRPVVSIKARRLGSEGRQLVLDIHPQANKPMVARALRFLFNMDVGSIRTVMMKPKRRRVGKRLVQGIMRKRAYITLKDGQTISQLGGLDASATGVPAVSHPGNSENM